MTPEKVKRMDNHRIFRPEAVEAYSTRRAGEPWGTGLGLEGWVILVLTLLTICGIFAILRGGL